MTHSMECHTAKILFYEKRSIYFCFDDPRHALLGARMEKQSQRSFPGSLHDQ